MLVIPWLLSLASSKSKAPFYSKREQRLWLSVLVVLIAIYSTLGPAANVVSWLRQNNLLCIYIVNIILLALINLIWRWVRQLPTRGAIAVVLGVAAVYLMTWMRIEIVGNNNFVDFNRIHHFRVQPSTSAAFRYPSRNE